MNLALDSSTITHSIQLAVAPVFLLTAMAGMIGAVAGRLARSSTVHAWWKSVPATLMKIRFSAARHAGAGLPAYPRTHGQWLHWPAHAVRFLISVTIILLFLGETTNFRGHTGAGKHERRALVPAGAGALCGNGDGRVTSISTCAPRCLHLHRRQHPHPPPRNLRPAP